MGKPLNVSETFTEVSDKLLQLIPVDGGIGDESLQELLDHAELFVVVIKEHIEAQDDRYAAIVKG